MIDNGAFVAASAVVQVEHFYVESHRRVWAAMAHLSDLGTAIDHVTLANRLRAIGDWDRIGGVGALDGLTDAVASTQNVAHYAEIVRSSYGRRQMIGAAQQVVADGFDESQDTEEFVASARTAMARADAAIQGRYRSSSIAQVSQEVFASIEKRGDNPDTIALGFGGIRIPRGLLTVVAGRPSNGKSVLALNAALNVARSGGRVVMFTLEDTRNQLVSRAASCWSGVPLTQITERQVDLEQWPRVVDAFGRISQLDIEINDRTRATSSWVRQMSALHHQVRSVDLVIVDYVQLMRESRAESREQEIARATLGVVELAGELGVAAILVSQLRRPDGSFKDKVPPPPHLDMLKGSGTLEESAHVAILVHYPHFYDEAQDAGYLWCRVAKNKNGPVYKPTLVAKMDQMWVGDPDVGAAADPSGDSY